ncbi:MAG TPA: TRAP transporter small permease [Pseudogracilibacillus sp.]|nr:TRAP transporter small permease [Pseudogracilibacillus sp.]
MSKIIRINNFIRNIALSISAIAILIMMFGIVADVFMRNVLGTPLRGTYEIVENILMPALVFPVLGYVYWSGVLPKLTEIAEKLPKAMQNFNKYLIYLLDILVFSLLTYYGMKFALTGLEQKMAIPVAGKILQIWPVYFLVPLGFFLVVVEIVIKFFNENKKAA